jgi:hypothetical protein
MRNVTNNLFLLLAQPKSVGAKFKTPQITIKEYMEEIFKWGFDVKFFEWGKSFSVFYNKDDPTISDEILKNARCFDMASDMRKVFDKIKTTPENKYVMP